MAFADVQTRIGDILASDSLDGEVRVNVGDKLTGDSWVTNAPVWGIDGFFSRPNDTDEDGAAMAYAINDGERWRVVATRDNRFASKVGEMQPGDRMIVSVGEARFLLKAETDTISLYTANQTDGDSSMMVSLNGETGQILLANGGSFFEMKKDGWTISGGGVSMSASGGALQVCGKHTALNTKTGNLGALGPVVTPPGVGSLLAGVSGPTATPSVSWTIAPG